MLHMMTVLAYLGPETMLPMTSIVAGIVGFVMMFGRNTLRLCSAAFRRLTSKSKPGPQPGAPVRKIGNGPVARVGSRETVREQTQD